MSLKEYAFLFLMAIVIGTGLPIDHIADRSYEITKYLGVDIPMTPLTSDMAMMSDVKGTTSYEKQLKLIVNTQDGQEEINEKRLHFYLQKIPLHLYFEIISYHEYSEEAKLYLCKKFEDLLHKPVLSFNLETLNKTREDQAMGFNKNWVCNE